MKVIGGDYKGRIIEMPKGIRPTSDKVREALFEILKSRIKGARFLDLYCGSGAIGIEALSRGAEKAAFIDNNRSCISILKRNMAKLGISQDSYDIYGKDCLYILGKGGFASHRGAGYPGARHRGAGYPGARHRGAGYPCARHRGETLPYNIVFLDPPYCMNLAKNTLKGLSNCDILTPNALVIAEVFKKENLPEELGVFRKIRSCKYGDTMLEFYKKGTRVKEHGTRKS